MNSLNIQCYFNLINLIALNKTLVYFDDVNYIGHNLLSSVIVFFFFYYCWRKVVSNNW